MVDRIEACFASARRAVATAEILQDEAREVLVRCERSRRELASESARLRIEWEHERATAEAG